MKPYIEIRLYPQIQALATNIDYYDRKGELTKSTDTRYLVDHIYEIILPIMEQNPKHDITVRMNGKQLDLSQIEQSYYDCMNQ
jgi:hypothetical protein